ncbi:MAG: type II toxin-antitoxin system RelE/ParE family toxin [Aestuariivirga sp.]
MIRSFRHKGLEQFYQRGEGRRLPPELLSRIRLLLHALGNAKDVADLSVASYRLHSLKGDLRGFRSLTVRANWRIVFSFDDGDAYDVDFLDYH